MLYRFAHTDLRAVRSFVAHRLAAADRSAAARPRSVESPQPEFPRTLDGLTGYTEQFFRAVRVPTSKPVPGRFARELWEGHREAYQSFTHRATAAWLDTPQLTALLGSPADAFLAHAAARPPGDPSAVLELSLALRYALATDVILHHARRFRIKKITDTAYGSMVVKLQEDPAYYPLALAVRVAVALAEGGSVDAMLTAKGEHLQRFGCFFWVLC